MKSSINRPPETAVTTGAADVNDGTVLVSHKTRLVIDTNKKINEKAIMKISCIL
jgi:hypothetical protein